MGKIEVKFRPSALRDLKKIDSKTFDKVIAMLRRYTNGDQVNLKKLKSSSNLYRIRVDNYRIILELVIIENTAYVIRVGHRREVYKNLP